MGPVTIRRLLGDQRIGVGLGALVAVAATLFAMFVIPRSSGPPAANAVAQVLLDTTQSQLVTATSSGVVTLPTRATLVGDLMASDQLRAGAARDAHIASSDLAIFAPSSMATPAVMTPLVANVAPLTSAAATPYVVRLLTDQQTATSPTPVISIETQAPDEASARTLADATISALRSVFVPPRRGANPDFVVRMIMPPRTLVVPHRSRRGVYAVVGGVVIFVCWYGATLLGSGIGRKRRRTQLA
jgi:hypothetical protein